MMVRFRDVTEFKNDKEVPQMPLLTLMYSSPLREEIGQSYGERLDS